MPTFRYDAKDEQGKNLSGELKAESEREAVRQLHARGNFVLRVAEQKAAARAAAAAVEQVPLGLWRRVLQPVFFPVSSKAMSLYFSSFASTINAGMGMYEAAVHLSERAVSGVLRAASKEMAEAALKGQPITTVAPRYPAAFPPFVVSMLEAGDKAGMLDQAMRQLAEYYKHAHELEQLAKFESFYIKILIFALIFVPTLPTLVMGSFEAWLPMILGRLLWVLLGFGVVWYGWRLAMRVGFLRHVVDRIKLCIPFIGSIVRRGAVAKWCRAMSMLYAAGVPVHTALLAAGESSGNMALAASTSAYASRALAGDSISSIMAASGDFPAMAMDLMVTGERSGDVESSLAKVAEYYEEETKTAGKQGVILVVFFAYAIVMAIFAYYIVTGFSNYAGQVNEWAQPDAGMNWIVIKPL